MKYEYNKLLNNLAIGPAPFFGPMLASNGVNVLVLCAHEHQDGSGYPGIKVIGAGGSDADPMRANDDAVWVAAGKEVAAHVRAGDNVLVTCMMGQNRSGFVCAVALNLLMGWSGEKCVSYVQQYRPNALWNKAFVRWLTENLKEVPHDGA